MLPLHQKTPFAKWHLIAVNKINLAPNWQTEVLNYGPDCYPFISTFIYLSLLLIINLSIISRVHFWKCVDNTVSITLHIQICTKKTYKKLTLTNLIIIIIDQPILPLPLCFKQRCHCLGNFNQHCTWHGWVRSAKKVSTITVLRKIFWIIMCC